MAPDRNGNNNYTNCNKYFHHVKYKDQVKNNYNVDGLKNETGIYFRNVMIILA